MAASTTFINGVDRWFEKEKAIFDLSPNSSSAVRCSSAASGGASASSSADYALFIPEIEEVRLSSVISKKGYLSCLMASEHCSTETTKWSKTWIVVRRPYLFIYKDEKDPVERSVINLANARVECSEQQRAMLCVENAFSVVTKHAGYLFRCGTAREMYDWLYSINPLYAGQLMCEWAREHHAAMMASSTEPFKSAEEEEGGGGSSSASSPGTETQISSQKVAMPNLYQELCGSRQQLMEAADSSSSSGQQASTNGSCSVLQ